MVVLDQLSHWDDCFSLKYLRTCHLLGGVLVLYGRCGHFGKYLKLRPTVTVYNRVAMTMYFK